MVRGDNKWWYTFSHLILWCGRCVLFFMWINHKICNVCDERYAGFLYIWKKANKKESNILKNISFTAVACLNFTILSFFTLMLMFPKKYYGDKMFTQNDKVNNYLGKWTSKSDVVSLNVKLNYFVWNVFLPRRETNRTKKHNYEILWCVHTTNRKHCSILFVFYVKIKYLEMHFIKYARRFLEHL